MLLRQRSRQKRFGFKYQVHCSTFFLHELRHATRTTTFCIKHCTLEKKKCFQFLNVKYFSFLPFREKELKKLIYDEINMFWSTTKIVVMFLSLDIYSDFEVKYGGAALYSMFTCTRNFNYVSSLIFRELRQL